MESFLALPDTSDFLIHRLKVYIIALDVGNESFRQVSEEGLLRIQKAMLKCDVPADVRLWVDGFSFPSAGAPVLRKLVNGFSRIEHFSAEQIDPFVQKIVFRSIEMGSLRSMVLTNAMLSEEILTRIIKWTRGREFQSLWISTPKEDQFGFDRRVILEIAKEFEQRRVKIMLTLHKSVWPRYSTFDYSEFIVKESQNWSLRRIQFDRL
ncbi:hypothetical protein L596_010084 [Steinernema carpocapsae]|uniref:Uncharacterized protein n=1 Tax=Steinernema carpocapsae TaxID=34508 RepID=A0A4U5PI22_STECR|nr:hypothetical protein L596_010084 [Steinernema carpocapsae]